MIKFLKFDDAVVIHNNIIEKSGGAFGVRDRKLLLSAMQRPKNLNHYCPGVDLFETAATLISGITPNCPFFDGNKRCGLMCGLVFLWLNGKKIGKLDSSNAFRLMIGVAQNSVSDLQIANFLKKIEEI